MGLGCEHLSKFISSHPDLPKHVKFVGMINDSELIDLYRSALFGVFPSRIEGWGFGAAECLAFGTPVIISTAPSLNEATFNLMPSIDPDNEDGWYDHIRLLSENISAREALRATIARHYRTVSSKESWHAIKAIISRAN